MSHASRRRPAARRCAAALLLALTAATWGTSAPARADDAPRWSVRPADGTYGAGRSDLGYTVGPGGRIADAVRLTNPGFGAIRLRLSAADVALSPTGQLLPTARPSGDHGVAGWVHLQHAVVTVPGGRSVTVPFAVAPPRGALPGDHLGAIVTALDGVGAPQAGPGVPLRVRTSGALSPSLAVEGLATHYDHRDGPLGAGRATVSWTVRNTGDVVLTARQAVSVAGPLGTFRRRGAPVADSPPLPPGAAWRVSAPLEDVAPAVRLAATVELTPLQADAAGSIQPLASTTTTAHAWSVPWELLAVVVLVLALGALAVVLVRRTATADRPRKAAA